MSRPAAPSPQPIDIPHRRLWIHTLHPTRPPSTRSTEPELPALLPGTMQRSAGAELLRSVGVEGRDSGGWYRAPPIRASLTGHCDLGEFGEMHSAAKFRGWRFPMSSRLDSP